jgi:hypothetical protein
LLHSAAPDACGAGRSMRHGYRSASALAARSRPWAAVYSLNPMTSASMPANVVATASMRVLM